MLVDILVILLLFNTIVIVIGNDRSLLQWSGLQIDRLLVGAARSTIAVLVRPDNEITLLLRLRLPHSNRVTRCRSLLNFCRASVHLIVHISCLLRRLLVHSEPLVLHGAILSVSHTLADLGGRRGAASKHRAAVCGQLRL